MIDKYLSGQRIRLIPKKQKPKILVLDYAGQYIASQGSVFTEKELNEVLKVIYDDYATLRRYLVDYHYLERDAYGTTYQLITH